MEYEDLYTWLEKRREKSPEAAQPVILNIDLGSVLSKILTDRGEVRTRDRIAPYPS
jgi:hypothetical protein